MCLHSSAAVDDYREAAIREYVEEDKTLINCWGQLEERRGQEGRGEETQEEEEPIVAVKRPTEAEKYICERYKAYLRWRHHKLRYKKATLFYITVK